MPLNADHRSMTKFESSEDENFKRISRVLKRMMKGAAEMYTLRRKDPNIDREL